MRVAVDMFQIVQLGKLVRSAMIDGDVVSAFAKARDDRYARRRRSSNHQSRCHCRTFSKRDGGHPARHGIAWTVGRRPALVNNYVDERIAIWFGRSEEHTSELQSLMRISYAVFCLKQKKQITEK